MEKISELMERLGFREGAEDSVKAAFIQNLIFQAYGVKVEIPPRYQDPKKEVIQLSFDFENAG